jgi:hypothetical protein
VSQEEVVVELPEEQAGGKAAAVADCLVA